MYQYEYEAKGMNGAFGAFHGFDACFMFNNLDVLSEVLGDDADFAQAQSVADAITDAWATFAHTGTPAAQSLPDWPEFNSESRQTMMLNSQSRVVSDPDGHLRSLWSA